ncbi:hypothetical protein BDP67DRAFT_504618 [Colletotrichum lupini]|nr:hypothetical protein BDP67DRAFT_504618 [Colletotrichum lupini]
MTSACSVVYVHTPRITRKFLFPLSPFLPLSFFLSQMVQKTVTPPSAAPFCVIWMYVAGGLLLPAGQFHWFLNAAGNGPPLMDFFAPVQYVLRMAWRHGFGHVSSQDSGLGLGTGSGRARAAAVAAKRRMEGSCIVAAVVWFVVESGTRCKL